jgi:hypothetical protein
MDDSSVRIPSSMKIPELRKLIGKDIEWDDRPDPRGWYRTHWGRLTDVKSRNVLVDNNWYWLPQMRNIRLRNDLTNNQPSVIVSP